MFCGTSSSFSGAKHGSPREHFFHTYKNVQLYYFLQFIIIFIQKYNTYMVNLVVF